MGIRVRKKTTHGSRWRKTLKLVYGVVVSTNQVLAYLAFQRSVSWLPSSLFFFFRFFPCRNFRFCSAGKASFRMHTLVRYFIRNSLFRYRSCNLRNGGILSFEGGLFRLKRPITSRLEVFSKFVANSYGYQSLPVFHRINRIDFREKSDGHGVVSSKLGPCDGPFASESQELLLTAKSTVSDSWMQEMYWVNNWKERKGAL